MYTRHAIHDIKAVSALAGRTSRLTICSSIIKARRTIHLDVPLDIHMKSDRQKIFNATDLEPVLAASGLVT